jgi:hypothetical protein
MNEYELQILEHLGQIIATCNLLQGFIMLCIALIAIYILYKFISFLF